MGIRAKPSKSDIGPSNTRATSSGEEQELTRREQARWGLREPL
jgi:hypothetical protein